MIDYLPETITTIDVCALPDVVTNAIENIGFADEVGVKAAIGGSAAKYAAFKEWAGSVKVPAGSGGGGAAATQAGEAAVVANTNAAVAFLLGAERLLENAPTIEIGEVTVTTSATLPSGGLGTDRPTEMTVSVTVKDGDDVVQCAAEKVKEMFEATTDLGDWNGTARLEPTVTVADGADSAARDSRFHMRFTIMPRDGTAARAFLRVKVK